MPVAQIELGHDIAGTLLNVSEGGLALQSALVLWWGEQHDARFQLPGSPTWINARARVLRLSESKKEAGLEFVQISEESKAQIREWVAAGDLEGPAGEDNRREVGRQPNPPEILQETKEQGPQEHPARWADPVVAPFGEGQAWETLAPAPLASNWVDSDVYGSQQTDGAARNTGWLRFTLVAMALAVTFFFVGSNIAQTPLQRWFVSAMQRFNWSKPNVAEAPQGPAANPTATPATNTPAPLAATPSETDSAQEKTQPADQGAQHAAETPPASADPQAPPETSSPDAVGKSPSSEPASAARGTGAKKPAAGFHLREEFPGDASSATSHQPPPVPAAGIERGGSELAEHIILVTAPAAGNPDFYVNLPEEAISASARIAMSARRSLRISPRSARPQAERVRVGQIVSRSEPYYPAGALSQKIDGNVQLHAFIAATGEITNVRVVSGPPLLAAAAAAAVRDWRYEPTLIDGNAVPTELDVLVSFRLR